MEIYRKMFGKKLREARKKADITQAVLAHNVGVEPPSVSRWETGEDFPGEDRLPAICRALGVPDSYFTTDEAPLALGFDSAAELLSTFASLPLQHQKVVLALIYKDASLVKGLSEPVGPKFQALLKAL